MVYHLRTIIIVLRIISVLYNSVLLSLNLIDARWIKGWRDPVRIIGVVVVVDIAGRIHIPRIVRVAGIRGTSFI